MSEKRLILHLGTPKTGTTSLQNVLVAEEDALAGAGLRYVKTCRAAINHNRLVMQLSKGGSTADRVTRRLHREIAGAQEPSILISTEIGYGIRPTQMLFTALGDWAGSAEIIVYVRRQDLLLEAMAKQKLKSGHYRGSLEAFIATRRRGGNYMTYIREVQRRIPGVRITCRPYDRGTLLDGDVITDFWQFLGLGELPRAKGLSDPVNVTPCRELAIALSEQDFATPQHRRKVISAIQAARPDLFKSKDILTAQERRALQEGYREENRALGAFCCHDLEALFNDDVDYEAESRPIKDPAEREAVLQAAKAAVHDMAERLRPEAAEAAVAPADDQTEVRDEDETA
ncbi:MAG: hypothetical protein AAFQ54_08320 [Pseudomonadota bacterium]